VITPSPFFIEKLLINTFAKLGRSPINIMSSSENDHALIGEVSLSVDLENYNPNEPSNSLFFHVTIGDSGNNISNIDIPDLFLPFNRPGTENELPDNLDLDLAICRQLVERAGGGIWVEARGESTKGSVVHFSFKLAAVNVESGPPFSWQS
jgi:signal transduction histidine kinase